MKYVFIVNPAAGKKKAGEFIPKIQKACKTKGVDYEVYQTSGVGDARNYTRTLGESGEEVTVFGCGGDGTLFEVINGAVGFDNLTVGTLPLGSGNDFVRNFGKKKDFLDVDAQLEGRSAKIDLIKCGEKFAISQCSMGLDAEVCAKQAAFKKLPFMSGEMAYTASLVFCFLTKASNVFEISIDDGEFETYDLLFSLCGNARYYGGGYKGIPLAICDDGLLDFVIVKKDMPVIKFLKLMNDYKAGKHIEWDRTIYKRGRKMTVRSKKFSAVNVDGECEFVRERTFEVVPRAVNFTFPSNVDYDVIHSTWDEENKSWGKLFTFAV